MINVMKIMCSHDYCALSEETAHSTVYQHLSQQSRCIKTAQRSLRWRCTVGWAVSSKSVVSKLMASSKTWDLKK